MSPNGLAAASTISGQRSASCWPITASWFSASASARALIASASAIPRARTASPSAKPLARVASASATPTIRVCSECAVASRRTRSAPVAASLGLECLGLLLLLGRFPIGARLRDASLPLDGDGVRSRHVLDVSRRVVDLLDLKRIDDQTQLLHFGSGMFTGELREFLAVADHFLDRHVADDRPQVAGEDVVHPLVHLVLLIEEPASRVGDGCVIIANLVDDDRSDLERDALLAHTVDLQVGLAQVER